MIWVSDDVTGDGARWMAVRLEEAVRERGEATLAVAGGTSPAPLYLELAGLPVPWHAVTVYFGDERAVAPSHADSNYGMVDGVLLSRVAAAAVYRMEAERPDRDAAAREYEDLLPEVFDLVVLGLGADGHTASLFPGTDWSRPTGRRVLPTTAPVAPHQRLSLTPEALRAARDVLVVATGEGKARAVRDALEGEYEPARVPAQVVRDGTWLIDRAAAAHLEKIG